MIEPVDPHSASFPALAAYASPSVPSGFRIRERVWRPGPGHLGPQGRVLVGQPPHGLPELGFSGYFTTTPLIITGPGSVTEADVSRLNSTGIGFTSYLEP
jgi:hypothetical protein